MPNNLHRYKKKRGKLRRRKRPRGRYRQALGKWGLMSPTFKTTLRYVDTIELDPDLSANMVYKSYSANGVFDPQTSLGGHQPLGFDQYMAFYNHCTVIGSKIKCTFMNKNTTGPQDANAYAGVMLLAGPAPVALPINTVMEYPLTKSGVIALLAGGNKKNIITKKCNPSKFFGQKVLQEDANANSVTSNPAEQCYFVITAGTNDVGVHDPNPIRVLVEIEYICVFHEPKQLVGS